MALDAANVLFNTAEFGESIVYTAKRSDYIEATAAPGSGDKTISAYVQRDVFNPDASGGGDRSYLINRVRFYISKDATKGIATVNPGQDKATISIKAGETAVQMRVMKIIEESPGWWYLEAEK